MDGTHVGQPIDVAEETSQWQSLAEGPSKKIADGARLHVQDYGSIPRVNEGLD